MSESAEQKARDILEKMGIEDAQSFTAGDLVYIANLIRDNELLREALKVMHQEFGEHFPDNERAVIDFARIVLQKTK